MLDVANGLYSIHKSKVIHLDLKSQNVLVNEHGRCKIADLGLGRLLSKNDTLNQAVAGTVAYMSPEQLLSSGRIGFKSDIWAFGVCLWEVGSFL